MVTKKVTKKTVKSAKKMVAKHNKDVTKANKLFEKLTPAEKRVQIARDVLSQLKSGKIKATPGFWLTTNVKEDELGCKTESGILTATKAKTKAESELCDVLKGLKSCNACALGGMFMCAVERADKLKVKDLSEFNMLDSMHVQKSGVSVSENDAFSYLKAFFPMSQLQKIESAFERGCGACYDDNSAEFAEGVEDNSERMRLIMENIIANKGTFKPEKKPVTKWVTPGFVA